MENGKKRKSAKVLDIIISNKLEKEKRDLTMYLNTTRESHLVSANSSRIWRVKPGAADDYLHIAVAPGPGYIKNTWILDIPSYLNVRFQSSGEFVLLHSEVRTELRIPPGPSDWQIRLTVSPRASVPGHKGNHCVHVQDSNSGEINEGEFYKRLGKK